MFCASCGKQVNQSYKYCDGCGAPVKAPVTSSVAEASLQEAVPAAVAPSVAPDEQPPLVSQPSIAAESPSLSTVEQPLTSQPAVQNADTSAATRTCPSCGKQVNAGYRFCDGCGASIETGGIPASAPAPYESTPYFTPAAGTQPKSGGGIAIVVVLVLLVLAAGGGLAYWKLAGSTGASKVDVAITPAQITVAPGATQIIEASVTGTDDKEVTWRLQEGAVGGEIVPAGATAHDGRVYGAARYTAPGTPGVYHAIAVSNADPKKAAGVTITVR